MNTIKNIVIAILIILCLGFLISGMVFKSTYDPTFYQKRLQPTIGVYYEVIYFSGHKDPSVFVIVKELQFENVYGDLVVISKRMHEVELPFKNQIGKSGKYFTVITVDGVLTVKNFSDLSELRAYKKL